jgi:NhaA family Na+:H+ antiporter
VSLVVTQHRVRDRVPWPPFGRLLQPVQEFIETEAAGGGALLLATVAALVWANSPWSGSYDDLLHHHFLLDLGFYVVDGSVHFWVNDALMVLFFFLVGMEIKRELVAGELNSMRRAAVPFAAAAGGMVVPAAIFLLAVHEPAARDGWGVPIATDIAFALGVTSLLGPRVPAGLKVLLLALAIFDDLGAVAVIAVAYTDTIAAGPLLLGLALLGAVYVAGRLGVRELPVYVLLGALAWAAVQKSGIHPTTVGVALGLLTPLSSPSRLDELTHEADGLLRSLEEEAAAGSAEARRGRHADALLRLRQLGDRAVPPLDRLEHALNPWVAFLVVPLFALANAGVDLRGDTLPSALGEPLTWGIAAGLFLGKPAGILLGTWLAIRLGAQLPEGVSWRGVLALGVVAGIGFTVALFVAQLAYPDEALLTHAKVGIFGGSIVSGVAGYLLLRGLPAPGARAG